MSAEDTDDFGIAVVVASELASDRSDTKQDGDDDAASRDGDRTIATTRRDASSRGSRRGRVIRRGIALLAVAGLAYFFVNLEQVWSTGRADHRESVDAIVVMGAAQYDGRPSPQLEARLDQVLELWPEGIAPLVVVTGGNIPGDRFTEAEASERYLVERGVPEESILREDAGSNSYESLESVAEMLDARGADNVVIVTDPYHSLRSQLIAEELGLDASVSATSTSVVRGAGSFSRHVREAGGVAVGRLIGFDRLTELLD